METPSSEGQNNPATAGKTQEGQTMDLSEFLKTNPAAAAEIDRMKADAKAEGRKEAQAEFQTVAKKCTAVLEGKAYPDAVRVKACQTLRGAVRRTRRRARGNAEPRRRRAESRQ
jgi:hypothetical protein